jgi:hypothetical protein
MLFKHLLLNAKEQLHVAVPAMARQEGVAVEPTPAFADQVEDQAAATPSADIPALIEELDELRNKGLLTDREFRSKKKDLLDRL